MTGSDISSILRLDSISAIALFILSNTFILSFWDAFLNSFNDDNNSTLSLICKVVISGEVYSQPQYGIGTIIQFEKMQLNTSRIIAWMIIITGIVFLFDLIISRIFKKHKL